MMMPVLKTHLGRLLFALIISGAGSAYSSSYDCLVTIDFTISKAKYKGQFTIMPDDQGIRREKLADDQGGEFEFSLNIFQVAQIELQNRYAETIQGPGQTLRFSIYKKQGDEVENLQAQSINQKGQRTMIVQASTYEMNGSVACIRSKK